ncbi:MAG: hypothetical protein BV457_01300 [Thermoplasmata archaeon M9B1D]|nr:MAG: hypothetical protein BV457_01300 [Thermoplasmata archaeon M9B1D]
MLTGATAINGTTKTINNTTNNCIIEEKICYGYQAYPNPDLIVRFELNNPEILYTIATPISMDKISGATWIDDKWWCSEYAPESNSNIWIIDHITGEMILVGSSGSNEGLNGLAYDDISDTLYACGSKNLFTIDMQSGTATLVGPFGITNGVMSGLACDGFGMMYGNDLHTDSLYSINLENGSATLIGSFGVDLNHGQDMEFDKETGICYLAAFTVDNGDEGALYTCNLNTAKLTKIGNFGTVTTQITGFAIPYTLDDDDDIIRPRVFINTPTENETVKDTITINGTAYDLDGNIKYVYLKIGNEGDWIKAQGTEQWQKIWDTTIYEDGSYIISALAIDNQGYQSPVIYRKTIVKNHDSEPEKEPDLYCEGGFNWINLKPGAIVNGSFIIKNIGDAGSLLNWTVSKYPDWGTWYFMPSNGDNVKPEDGIITVEVKVIAPDIQETNFSGQIKIENKENTSDYEIINVSLTTYKDKQINILLSLIEKLIQRFPFFEKILNQII